MPRKAKKITLTCELKFDDPAKQSWFDELMLESPDLVHDVSTKFESMEQLLGFLDSLFSAYEDEKSYHAAMALLTVFKANRILGLREALRAVLRVGGPDSCDNCLDNLVHVYESCLADLNRNSENRHPELPNDEAAFIIAYMSHLQPVDEYEEDEEDESSPPDPTLLN